LRRLHTSCIVYDMSKYHVIATDAEGVTHLWFIDADSLFEAAQAATARIDADLYTIRAIKEIA
jgi:hypothetical protein